MARNIEMNYKNGSDSYEILYPNNQVSSIIDLESYLSENYYDKTETDSNTWAIGDIRPTTIELDDKWLLCDGGFLSGDEYSELYEIRSAQFNPYLNYQAIQGYTYDDLTYLYYDKESNWEYTLGLEGSSHVIKYRERGQAIWNTKVIPTSLNFGWLSGHGPTVVYRLRGNDYRYKFYAVENIITGDFVELTFSQILYPGVKYYNGYWYIFSLIDPSSGSGALTPIYRTTDIVNGIGQAETFLNSSFCCTLFRYFYFGDQYLYAPTYNWTSNQHGFSIINLSNAMAVSNTFNNNTVAMSGVGDNVVCVLHPSATTERIITFNGSSVQMDLSISDLPSKINSVFSVAIVPYSKIALTVGDSGTTRGLYAYSIITKEKLYTLEEFGTIYQFDNLYMGTTADGQIIATHPNIPNIPVDGDDYFYYIKAKN